MDTCPQCGFDTDRLHEGYCLECRNERQRVLDEHNAAFDAWERLSDEQRADRIRRAAHGIP